MLGAGEHDRQRRRRRHRRGPGRRPCGPRRPRAVQGAARARRRRARRRRDGAHRELLGRPVERGVPASQAGARPVRDSADRCGDGVGCSRPQQPAVHEHRNTAAGLHHERIVRRDPGPVTGEAEWSTPRPAIRSSSTPLRCWPNSAAQAVSGVVRRRADAARRHRRAGLARRARVDRRTDAGGGAPRVVPGHAPTTTELHIAHILSDDEGYLYLRYTRRR